MACALTHLPNQAAAACNARGSGEQLLQHVRKIIISKRYADRMAEKKTNPREVLPQNQKYANRICSWQPPPVSTYTRRGPLTSSFPLTSPNAASLYRPLDTSTPRTPQRTLSMTITSSPCIGQFHANASAALFANTDMK